MVTWKCIVLHIVSEYIALFMNQPLESSAGQNQLSEAHSTLGALKTVNDDLTGCEDIVITWLAPFKLCG